MTMPIVTPCQTGNLCLVPKRRDELLDNPFYAQDEAEEAIKELVTSCDHETHPDDWYEDPGSGYGTAPYWRTQRAKARCLNDCPIRLQCLNIAMDTGQVHGIWGGYTSDQRAKIRDHRQLFLLGRINERKEDSDGTKDAPAEESSPAGPA